MAPAVSKKRYAHLSLQRRWYADEVRWNAKLQSERLAMLEAKRAGLQSERARLEAEIRNASSRQTLGTTVERRLGMHVPTDRQVVILPRARQDEGP